MSPCPPAVAAHAESPDRLMRSTIGWCSASGQGRSLALFALLLLACHGPTAVAAPVPESEGPTTTLPNQLTGVGVDEHPGAQLPLDATFLNDRGVPTSLRQICGGTRPIILSLNYSNCPMLCNLQLTGLVRSLQQMDWTVGEQFDVVSVSVDPLEQPTRAAATKQRYVQEYGRAGSAAGWHFLVGNAASIQSVTSSVGFRYQYDTARKEYAHPAVFVMVTPDGRISQYIYGVEFKPQTLRLQLVEASGGKIGTTFDRILLFCFHYDASAGRYTVAARNVMSAGGAITALVLGAFLGRYFYFERLSRGTRHGSHDHLPAGPTAEPTAVPS